MGDATDRKDGIELPGNDPTETQDRTDIAATPIIRTAIAGILMGLANLVPGVSGGTMIVALGLYDEFVNSIADATRFRFTRQSVLFLTVLTVAVGTAIALLAGTMSHAVTTHTEAMFSLFIGMTLGGVPLLTKMLGRPKPISICTTLVGLGLMLTIALTNPRNSDSANAGQENEPGEFMVSHNYPRDVAAGALGMSAMVLPGISGAYMFLIVGRYEAILAAISATKDYAFSLGSNGDPSLFLPVLVPVAIGALLGLVLLSNVLKWVLRRHREATIGLLIGIVLGSVVGIWPFDADSTPGSYLLGLVLAAAGFTATMILARLKA